MCVMRLNMEYLMFVIFCLKVATAAVRLNTAEQALEYVHKTRDHTCGVGTGEVLPLQFEVTVWNRYTDPAIRTANFFSKIIERDNGTLDSLTDDIFFLLVRNNVHGDSIIFGSGIALETGVYSKYDMFCPYAYKKNGTVRSHDIAVNYNYHNPNTVWYTDLRTRDWTNRVDIVTDRIQYREDDHHLPVVEESYPLAKLSDGYWTYPYYDCGGGDVWMVTYSAPIFKRTGNGSTAIFQGVATIDIELTYIDINQCNFTEGQHLRESSGLDIFFGTHKCQPTTECVPLKGEGFVTGAYRCECIKGYYFPVLDSEVGAFTGTEIEGYFRTNSTIEPGMFQCRKCARGCDTCIDDSPCLHQHSEALIFSLLILAMLTVLGIICIGVVTYKNREKKVIKSASPLFLELMCLGGIFLCSKFFTSYFETTVFVCIVKIWPEHIGFCIVYGSLVLKTWRIYKIFTIGARKKIYLPDKVLQWRFGIILLIAIIILAAWTASQPPEVKSLRSSQNLLFYICYYGPWEYTIIAAEILLLMYGVYLCFTIRKAPKQFNDRFLSYAIYNAIILGFLMSLAFRFFTQVIGPDLVLVLDFIHMQVYAPVTLLFVFVPKFLALRKDESSLGNSTGTLASTSTAHSRFTKKFPNGTKLDEHFQNCMIEFANKSTQTGW